MFTLDDLYKFALDNNADQVYAIIDDSFQDDESLTEIAQRYENAELNDLDFCMKIISEIEQTKTF